MFKKFIFAAAIICLSATANAVDVTPPATATTPPAISHAGSAASGKVDYDSLSRAEKIKYINQHHEESVKRAELKWKSTSDDDKITKYEKRRNAFIARRAAKSQTAASPAPARTASTGTAPVSTAPASAPPVSTAPMAK